MPAAGIDVGSNTLRLIVGSILDNRVSPLYSDRIITRLAEGVRKTGRLREENMRRSLSALRSFADSMSRFGVSNVKAVGTSALRDAENSGDFVAAVYARTGISIEVISGIREAELTLEGVLSDFPDLAGSSLIIDIGGGSTEWIMQDSLSRVPFLCGTAPLGVVNLSEKFIRTDPPAATEISALVETIDSSLRSSAWSVPTEPGHIKWLIGTGGTVTTLASMDLHLKAYDRELIHMHRLGREQLRRMRDQVAALAIRERQGIAGLEAGRADLIIPGILLTMRIMVYFGFDEMTVSESGLLEGLLKEIDNEEGFREAEKPHPDTV